MAFPISIDLEPMEAASVATIPEGDQWQYEPKWDGFRCLVFRDGVKVELRSKSGQPLGRYFPEVVAAVSEVNARQFVIFRKVHALRLSPATTQLSAAKKWFGSAGTSLDGLIAKRLDLPYTAGERKGMVKIKPHRTADCVVGGFRYAEKGGVVGSLLLGLYDDDGRLHHVGFCSGLKNAERPALTKKLEALEGGSGFTGKAPGGPSRWSTKRSTEWEPLDPKLVVEVSYDHVTGARFRHGTSLLRWRPDKAPRQCTMEQLQQKKSRALGLLK